MSRHLQPIVDVLRVKPGRCLEIQLADSVDELNSCNHLQITHGMYSISLPEYGAVGSLLHPRLNSSSDSASVRGQRADASIYHDFS